jgi:hypothetical protein
MAKLKEDGEFQVEGSVAMWLPVEAEEGERVKVNSAKEIWPEQVWLNVNQENGNWVVGTASVKGRIYRKDNTVGERWDERMYSGPHDDGEFEGPEWLVDLISREVPRRLSGRTTATEAVQAPPVREPVKVSPQRSQFDSALRVLLMRENLDGTEWAIEQLRESADSAERVAAADTSLRLDKDIMHMTLRIAADELEKLLDKRAAELATKGH